MTEKEREREKEREKNIRESICRAKERDCREGKTEG